MGSMLRSRVLLHLEILVLRHRLAALQGGGRRPRPKPADRLLWVWLSRAWSGWQDALVLVKPGTVISWRCHHSLEMDCPGPRPVQPPVAGRGERRPETAGFSCSLVCLGPEAPASQGEVFGTDRIGGQLSEPRSGPEREREPIASPIFPTSVSNSYGFLRNPAGPLPVKRLATFSWL